MSYTRRGKTYFYVGAVLFLLVLFNFLGWLNPLKTGVRLILNPVLAQLNLASINLNDRLNFIKNQQDYISQYNQCKTDLGDKSYQEAQVELLQSQNAELKKQLAFRQTSKIQMVTADVVKINTDSTEKTVIINRGVEDGIKPDDPVIISEGILVGKVIKVENDMATVRLISDNQSRIAATVLNSDHSMGVVEGGYGISIRMDFIPRNETVRAGDKIITSGLETNIPLGLLIGSVAAVENEAYQPFQQAVLAPTADLSKLFTLSVLLTN